MGEPKVDYQAWVDLESRFRRLDHYVGGSVCLGLILWAVSTYVLYVGMSYECDQRIKALEQKVLVSNPLANPLWIVWENSNHRNGKMAYKSRDSEGLFSLPIEFEIKPPEVRQGGEWTQGPFRFVVNEAPR